MKIIVTGGTGMIGSALIKALSSRGDQVIVLTRNPDKHSTSNNAMIHFVGWDGKSTEGWCQYFEKTDAVINLAGENIAGDNLVSLVSNRWTSRQKEKILYSRLLTGKALLKGIEQSANKPKVFLQASAVGYYGNQGNNILDETSPAGNDFLAEVCINWEEATRKIEDYNIRRVILRTAGVVLSANQGAFPYILLPYRFFLGGTLGDGQQWFSWIHIQDEINAIIHLLDNPQAAGPFNLCAPEMITARDLSRTISELMKRPAWFPVPAIIFRLLLGEKADLLLGSQRQTPSKLIASRFTYLYPNIKLAIENIINQI